MNTKQTRSVALIVALGVLSFGAGVVAQSGADVASRGVLLQQAVEARRAGDHARALDLAERARQLGQSLSILRFIAEEEEALGRVADGLGHAQVCLHLAEAEPRSDNRDHVVAGCQAIATRLTARVGYVIVQVPTPRPAGLEVRVAGNPVPSALWGVETIVSSGSVDVEASAPGRVAFHTQVHVDPGAHPTVSIVLSERTATEASAAPSRVASAAPAPAVAQSGVRASSSPRPAANQTAATASSAGASHPSVGGPLGLLVAGAVVLGGGLAVYEIGDSRYSCNSAPPGCSASDRSTITDMFYAGLGGEIAGGVVMAIGLGWLIYAVGVKHPERVPQVGFDPIHRGINIGVQF